MSDLIAIAGKVADLNNIALHMKGLRIQGDTIIASNLSNTFRAKGLPFDSDIDCFVDADTFLSAWKSIKNPKVEQDGQVLTVKSNTGKTKVEITLKDKDNFSLGYQPEVKGAELDPTALLAAIKRMLPFLKIAKNQLWLVGPHLYCTNSYFLVRTPHDTEMPEFDRPLTITLPLAEILQAIDEKPVSMTVSEDVLFFEFENCSLESSRFNPPLIGDMPALFQQDSYTDAKMEPLPDDVQQELKGLISFADPKDTITFDEDGIKLMQSGKISWTVSHPMPDMLFNAAAFKQVLANGKEFCFDNPTRIVFRSPDIEGLWAAMSSEKTKTAVPA